MGEGVAVQDGQGGSEVPLRAEALAKLGFDVAGLLDNEDRTVDRAVVEAEAAGVEIFRWTSGHKTESEFCAALGVEGLNSFLELGTLCRGAKDTVLGDLKHVEPCLGLTSLDVQEWINDGVKTLEGARVLVAQAADVRKWFKNVDDGRALGRWFLDHRTEGSLAAVAGVLEDVQRFAFPDMNALPAP